ncbi:MAG: aspartate kinase [Ruminiclostridium sp.]|nr:aspartate kinase [Ruminiclostridium sp.]
MTTITRKDEVSIITFANIPYDSESTFICSVFSAAARENVVIDMISKAPVSAESTSVGFTFDDGDMPKMLKVSNEVKPAKPPMINSGNVKFIIKSADMIDGVGFAENVFKALAAVKANPILITTAVDEISVVVRESDSTDLEAELERIFA